MCTTLVSLGMLRKINYTLCLSLLLVVACKNANPPNNIDVANNFIDTFYSFDGDSLALVLSLAQGSQPNILYYQKWAECAHYKVMNKGAFIAKNDSVVLCPITVKDDLMGSLGIDFNVTDTFHVSVIDGRIHSVETSSNDPEAYYHAKEWVKLNRPEYVEQQCKGIWEGGPTPCECVQGMVKGFDEFKSIAPISR